MGEVEGLAAAILDDVNYTSLFDANELQEIKKEASPEDLDIPNLLINDDWGITPVDYTSMYVFYTYHITSCKILYIHCIF